MGFDYEAQTLSPKIRQLRTRPVSHMFATWMIMSVAVPVIAIPASQLPLVQHVSVGSEQAVARPGVEVRSMSVLEVAVERVRAGRDGVAAITCTSMMPAGSVLTLLSDEPPATHRFESESRLSACSAHPKSRILQRSQRLWNKSSPQLHTLVH